MELLNFPPSLVSEGRKVARLKTGSRSEHGYCRPENVQNGQDGRELSDRSKLAGMSKPGVLGPSRKARRRTYTCSPELPDGGNGPANTGDLG